MNFPLIYCNGSSYSSETYNPANNGTIYANYIAQSLNGFVLNKSRNGNSNKNILRTSVHDIIHQRKINPDQKIIAIIGFTYELRSDIWREDIKPDSPEQSHFRCHSFTELLDWRERLLNNLRIFERRHIPDAEDPLFEKFYVKYTEGKAYFFSPYAERINLYCDLLMFTALCQKYDINYLIFSGSHNEKLEQEYLADFFREELYKDERIFNLEEFGFVKWCQENNFPDLDIDTPRGHFGPQAHETFANDILLPTLKATNQI